VGFEPTLPHYMTLLDRWEVSGVPQYLLAYLLGRFVHQGLKPLQFFPVLATCFASLSASSFPFSNFELTFWCALICLIATFSGSWTASSSFKISSACLMFFPWEFNNPLSLQIAPCACTIPKVYFESVYIFTTLLWANSKVWVTAITSAFCAEVFTGKGLDYDFLTGGNSVPRMSLSTQNIAASICEPVFSIFHRAVSQIRATCIGCLNGLQAVMMY